MNFLKREFNKKYLSLNVFIRAREIKHIAECHGWDDIDYSQIKSILDDFAKLTVGFIDYGDIDSTLDIDFDSEDSTKAKHYIYYKSCMVDFKGCNLCFFKGFKIANKYKASNNMITMLIDNISLQAQFDTLREIA